MAVQKDIKGSDIAPIYVFTGEETAAKSKALKALKTHLLTEEEEVWNYAILDGGEITAEMVADAAVSPPLMGRWRLVVVHCANKIAAGELDTLTDLLDAFPGTSCLVLVASSIDRRRKFFQKVKKLGRIYDFTTPKPEQLTGWVRRQGKAKGLDFQVAAAKALVEVVGPQVGSIEREIEKLALYIGENGEVTVQDVQAVASPGAPEAAPYAIFDLVDAIGERRTGPALKKLHELLGAGEPPLIILTMIARQFRFILGAQALENLAPYRITKELNLKTAFQAEKLVRQAQNFSRDQIAAALQTILEADGRLKLGGDPGLVLDTLVVRLTHE